MVTAVISLTIGGCSNVPELEPVVMLFVMSEGMLSLSNPSIFMLPREFVVEVVMVDVMFVMSSEEKPSISILLSDSVAPEVIFSTIPERSLES